MTKQDTIEQVADWLQLEEQGQLRADAALCYAHGGAGRSAALIAGRTAKTLNVDDITPAEWLRLAIDLAD